MSGNKIYFDSTIWTVIILYEKETTTGVDSGKDQELLTGERMSCGYTHLINVKLMAMYSLFLHENLDSQESQSVNFIVFICHL